MARERAERKIPIKTAQLDEVLVSELEELSPFFSRLFGRFHSQDEFPWRSLERPKSVLCFELNLPERVVFAIACPSEFVEKAEVILDERGHLLVEGKYRGATQRLDLGNPETGGVPEIIGVGAYRSYRIVGLNGKKMPRDSYLRNRRLFSDALRNNFGPDGIDVILVGLGRESATSFDFSPVKIIDRKIHEASPKSPGNKLAEFILTVLESGQLS